MGTRIALVDDDQNILTSVSLTLESEGFEVDCYHDGETALRGLSRRPAELAVLDIKTVSYTHLTLPTILPV